MKKVSVLLLALVMLTSILGACSKKETKELNLYTWAEYVPADVITAFEEKTGIKVNYTSFETNEEMLAKLENSKGGDYDIILASDYIIKLAADEGLVKELDKSKISNFSNIDPIYQGFFYDTDNQYTVPYAPGTPLIVYNPEMVNCAITGYESLWDASLSNNVALMDTERVIMGITLKTMGESFNTEDLSVIEAAGDKLMELAPNIRLLSQDQTHDYLISGEVGVAFLFTSQVAMALEANPDLVVVQPEEGLGFGVDAMFVPKNAPNADNAFEFLNYILDPEVGAQVAVQTLYLCANKASYEYIPEEYKGSLILNGSPEGEFIQDISSEAVALHDEIWTKFKSELK